VYPEQEVLVSAATVWEIEIQRAAGRLEDLVLVSVDLRLSDYGVGLLPLH
jgi:PIN domain nuclease of toxin-antitoxin system